MTTLVRKLGTGIATAAFLSLITSSAAFADASLEISGNGADSYNKIKVKVNSSCDVYQKNKTEVLTEVDSSAHTGGNKANGNTGGDVTVDTGDATSTVGVSVAGGSNTATDPCCLCNQTDQAHDLLISGNGEGSTNKIKVKKEKSSSVSQKNKTSVLTGVSSKAKTGKNKAKNNTGGDVDVKTGNADSTVGVSVTSSSNTLNP